MALKKKETVDMLTEKPEGQEKKRVWVWEGMSWVQRRWKSWRADTLKVRSESQSDLWAGQPEKINKANEVVGNLESAEISEKSETVVTTDQNEGSQEIQDNQVMVTSERVPGENRQRKTLYFLPIPIRIVACVG